METPKPFYGEPFFSLNSFFVNISLIQLFHYQDLEVNTHVVSCNNYLSKKHAEEISGISEIIAKIVPDKTQHKTLYQSFSDSFYDRIKSDKENRLKYIRNQTLVLYLAAFEVHITEFLIFLFNLKFFINYPFYTSNYFI